MKTTFSVKELSTVEETVSKIKSNSNCESAKLVIYFIDVTLDQTRYAKEIKKLFPKATVVGMSSHIGMANAEYIEGGISLAVLDDAVIEGCHTAHIVSHESAQETMISLASKFDKKPLELAQDEFFGLTLCDGVNGCEDTILREVGFISDIVFAGGTASDKLTFTQTFIHMDGEVFEKGCIMTLVKPVKSFKVLKTQSFKPYGKTATITKLGKGPRDIVEINGKPSVEEYAKLLGIPVDKINGSSAVYALAMQQGDEMFARDVHCTDGKTLLFACDMIEGFEYQMAHSTDILADTTRELNAVIDELGRKPSAIIHLQCALRYLNLESQGKENTYMALFDDVNMVGTTCYGEQAIGHMNNTGVFIIL